VESRLEQPTRSVGVVLGGFGADGGMNGPGEPANVWKVGEALARVPASGIGADLWHRHHDVLELLEVLDPDHVVIPVDWAQLAPTADRLDASVVARYRLLLGALRERGIGVELRLSDGCVPATLGQEFWLLPGAPQVFGAFVSMVAGALGDLVDRWETIHDPVRWVLEGFLLGSHPPFRRLAIDDACSALDGLLAAHVAGTSTLIDAGVLPSAISLGLSPMVFDLDRAIGLAMVAAASGADDEAISTSLGVARRGDDASAVSQIARVLNPLGLGRRRSWPARPTPRRFLEALCAAGERHAGVSISVIVDPVPYQVAAFGKMWALPRRSGSVELPASFDPAAGRGTLVEGFAWATRHNTLRAGQSERGLVDLLAARHALGSASGCIRYTYDGILDGYRHGTFGYRTGLSSVDRSRGQHGVTWRSTDAGGQNAVGAFARLVAALRETR